jgi:hypothetical protein
VREPLPRAEPVKEPLSARAPLPPLDVDRASVSIGQVSSNSGVTGANIRAALARAPFTRCYRDALRVRGLAAGGTATLHLKVNETGYVTAAALSDAQFLPAMRTCIEQAARAARVKDVDTGEATADVSLSFEVAP